LDNIVLEDGIGILEGEAIYVSVSGQEASFINNSCSGLRQNTTFGALEGEHML